MKDELARLPGVAEVAVIGGRDFAVRIHLDPDKLAARTLTFADVMRAMEQQDVEAKAGQPAGSGVSPDRMPDAPGGLMQPEQLQAMVIKADGGREVRLRDVATLELGAGRRASRDSTAARPRCSRSTRSCCRVRATWATVVQDRLAELRQRFPDGVNAFTGFDVSREPTAEAPGYLVTRRESAGRRHGGSDRQAPGRVEQSLRGLPGVRNVLALSEQPFDRDRDQPCLVVGLGPAANGPADRERLIREIRTGSHRRRAGGHHPAAGPLRGGPIPPIRLSDRVRDLRARSRPRAGAGRPARRAAVAGSPPDRCVGRPAAHARDSVEIDRAKAASLGVNPAEISAMLQAALGPAQAGRIDDSDGTGRSRWRSTRGAERRRHAGSAPVRTDKGQMVPLRAIAALRGRTSPPGSSDSISSRPCRSPPASTGD